MELASFRSSWQLVALRVLSRRFDKGLEDVRCISFADGLSLRPTLTSERPVDFAMDVCTRVELVLKPKVIPDPQKMRIRCNILGGEDLHVPFVDYVASLVSAIDAPVSVEVNGQRVLVHNGFPPEPGGRAQWLRTLSYVSTGLNARAAGFVDSSAARLREIRDEKTCYGLAAISIVRPGPCDFLSAKAVGGLTIRDGHELGHMFVGVIDYLPNSAKRDPGEIAAPKAVVEVWLQEQVKLLKDHLSPIESVLASYSLCDFDYDPIEVLQELPVLSSAGTCFWSLAELSDILSAGNRLGFRVSNYGSPRIEQHGEQNSIDGIYTYHVLGIGKFHEAEMSNGEPTKPKSLVGVIHRILLTQGASPTWTTHQRMYRGGIVGMCDCLEVQI